MKHRLSIPMMFSFFALGAAACGQTPSPRPSESDAGKPVEIVAHRGESFDAPENTLASVNLGWSRGGSAVEIDVHLTKDGKLILSHDADLKRTGQTELLIREHTVEELRKIDVGAWKAPTYANERMPLLEDVVATIPPNGRLFIEVKVGPEAVPELKRVLEASGKKPAQTPVISFNYDACVEVKKQLPEVEVYFLSSFKQDKNTKKWKPTAETLIKQAKEGKLDGLDLSAKGPVDAKFVKKVKDAGLQCYMWTVDEPARAKELADAGVDGITTNRAQWLRQQLGQEH